MSTYAFAHQRYFIEPAAQTAAPRRVMVPAAAVVRSGDSSRVWLVEEGKARGVNVDVGPERNEQVEVRSGLAGGESLILRPSATLKDGLKVKITSR